VALVDVLFRESFTVATPGRGLVDITAQVRAVVQRASAAAPLSDGLCTVFLHHTSASLVIQENADADVGRDLDGFLGRLVPDGDPAYRHTDEGPDDMSAHIRSALTATSVGIPIAEGRLDLGRWQAVWLWEHRTRAYERRVSVVVVGSTAR
jgi:secondary thiamine-phosphate synthase enzyme